MIEELKTDYKDDVLATSQQGKRTFNIVGKNGEILFEDVHIEDTSRYLQVGDEYGGDVINETNEYVNQMDDKLDELIEFMDNGVKAEDVTYNDSNVKLALDTLGNRVTRLKNVDLDTVTLGVYYVSSSCTNQPVAGDWGILICGNLEDNLWAIQLFIKSADNRLFIRRKINSSSWGAWSDTMRGNSVYADTSHPIIGLRQGTTRRIEADINENDHKFYLGDFVNDTFRGHMLVVDYNTKTMSTGYGFDIAGMRSTAGFIDLAYNGVNKANFFCNNTSGVTVLSAVNGNFLRLANDDTLEMQACCKSFAVANNAWSSGSPVYASAFSQWSSRLIKENIQSMSEDDGMKILDLNPVHFDFKESFGGKKNEIGLIAEETLEVIPEIVNVPENYDESEFDESKGLNNKLLTVDYVKLTPYLVKLCQMQQKQIDELTKRIEKLERR